MAEASCVYLVTVVPSGCTTYTVGDIVTTACSEPCTDRIIGTGACAGTMLTAVAEACMVYPPEDGLAAAEFDEAATKVAAKPKATAKPISPDEITGHFPQGK